MKNKEKVKIGIFRNEDRLIYFIRDMYVFCEYEIKINKEWLQKYRVIQKQYYKMQKELENLYNQASISKNKPIIKEKEW